MKKINRQRAPKGNITIRKKEIAMMTKKASKKEKSSQDPLENYHLINSAPGGI